MWEEELLDLVERNLADEPEVRDDPCCVWCNKTIFDCQCFVSLDDDGYRGPLD